MDDKSGELADKDDMTGVRWAMSEVVVDCSLMIVIHVV